MIVIPWLAYKYIKWRRAHPRVVSAPYSISISNPEEQRRQMDALHNDW